MCLLSVLSSQDDGLESKNPLVLILSYQNKQKIEACHYCYTIFNKLNQLEENPNRDNRLNRE